MTLLSKAPRPVTTVLSGMEKLAVELEARVEYDNAEADKLVVEQEKLAAKEKDAIASSEKAAKAAANIRNLIG